MCRLQIKSSAHGERRSAEISWGNPKSKKISLLNCIYRGWQATGLTCSRERAFCIQTDFLPLGFPSDRVISSGSVLIVDLTLHSGAFCKWPHAEPKELQPHQKGIGSPPFPQFTAGFIVMSESPCNLFLVVLLCGIAWTTEWKNVTAAEVPLEAGCSRSSMCRVAEEKASLQNTERLFTLLKWILFCSFFRQQKTKL